MIDEPKRQPAPAVVVIETHHDRHLTKVGGVMDDPEIDLTDGPVNVRVDVSTKQFYLANYKQVCYFSSSNMQVILAVISIMSTERFCHQKYM